MICKKCGKQLPQGASFCTFCGVSTAMKNEGAQFESHQGFPEVKGQNNLQISTEQKSYSTGITDNSKAYCILSYVGILWLFGLLLAPEKYNQRVRFNVGQGIVLSIVTAGVNVLVTIINFVIGAAQTAISGIFSWIPLLSGGPNILLGLIQWILGLAAAAFSIGFIIIGVLNVVNDTDKPLPFIGKFSFYK